MDDYFKPWNRKVGVASFVSLSVFVAIHARSLAKHDSLSIPLTNSTTIGVMSASGCAIFCIQQKENIEKNWKVAEWTTKSDPFDVDGIEWSRRLLGINIGRVIPCRRTNGVESWILTIDYSLPAILSLALSFCLLHPGPLLPRMSQDSLSWGQIVVIVVIVQAVIYVVTYVVSGPDIH